MADLWMLTRNTWPGALPERQPADVFVAKAKFGRGAIVSALPGALVIVLCGRISEWMSPDLDRSCIVREYGPREPIVLPVGQLRAAMKTEVLVLSPGWEASLKEAHALVRMLRDAEAVDLKRRISEVVCLTIGERVRRYVQDTGADIDKVQRQHLAHVIGASREMVSRVLKDMAQERIA